MRLTVLLSILLLSFSVIAAPTLFKEGSINLQAVSIGDSVAADAKSLLDIKSTTKGVLFPRMTSTQMNAISSPPTGLMVWNTTAANLYQYNGSGWVSAGTLSPLTTKGDIYTYSSTNARLAVGTDGYFLQADSTQTTGLKWAPAGLTTQGQSEVSGVTTTTLKAPNSQLTTTGTNERLIETGNKNVLLNADFEHSTPNTSWNASSGVAETTIIHEGKKSLKIVESATTGAILAQNVTPAQQITGENWEASLWIKTNATSSGAMQFCFTQTDYSQRLSCVDIVANNTWKKYVVNYPAGTSPGMVIYGTSITGNIYVDDAYLGPARNIGTVQQASAYGSIKYAGVTNCLWTTSATTMSNFSADSDCSTPTVTGNAAAPGTKIPGLTFASMPPGEYYIVATGAFTKGTATDSASAWRFSDGTNATAIQFVYVGASGNANTTSIIGRLKYDTPQSNVTLQIQGIVQNGSSTANIVANNASFADLEISVYYFPSQAQTVVRMDQSNYDWRAYTPTFTGFGTVSNIECQEKRDGSDNLIRCKFTSGTATATEARVSLPGSNVSAGTGKIPSIQISGKGVISVNGAIDLVTLQEPSVGYINFGVQNSGTPGTTKLNGNGFAASGTQITFTARIPIEGWTENQNAPLLVGGVTSNTAGMERIERAIINNNGSACSVIKSSSNWLTSPVRSGTGRCSFNFSPAFSDTPSCTCVAETTTGGCNIDSFLTASGSTMGFTTSNGGTNANLVAHIICMGPR